MQRVGAGRKPQQSFQCSPHIDPMQKGAPGLFDLHELVPIEIFGKFSGNDVVASWIVPFGQKARSLRNALRLRSGNP